MSEDKKAALKAQLWRAGKLRYLLHQGQKDMYDEFRAWEKFAYEERLAKRKLPGLYPRVYMLDCSRRVGKDFWSATVTIENAIRRPKSRLTYATAYAKDISSIVVPIFHQLLEDCPLDIKPEFKQSFQGTEAGWYFPNGSVVLLVGIDRNPDGLRGRYSDGIMISEAGFVDRLEYAVLTVLMPQLQGRLHACIVLNSTPPEIPGTWYDTHVLPDCRDNGRYQKKTILDNPMLSEAERDEFIAAAGGLESERCRREYFVERIRSEDLVVLPEWSSQYVRTSERPRYALAFTVIDPGVRDLCGVVTGWYDFDRAKTVFRHCWAKRGANTVEVAAAIRDLEAKTFGGPNPLRFWKQNKGLLDNPFGRFSDTEARMILDLSTLHKLTFAAADKEGAEASLNALRVAIKSDQVEVHPDAKELISHFENAVWNQNRTSYARSPIYGHYDLLDCAKYAIRMTNPWRRINPHPPAGYGHILSGKDPSNILWRPSDWKHLGSAAEKVASFLPKRKKSHTS